MRRREGREMTAAELVEIREHMRLRPEALASALGLSEATYADLEDDMTTIPPAVAMAVRYLVDNPLSRPSMHMDDVKPIGIDDMWEPFFDGKEYGPWRFSADSMTLDLNSRTTVVDRDGDGNDVMGRVEDYYIDLGACWTAKGVCDWLGQINTKGW